MNTHGLISFIDLHPIFNKKEDSQVLEFIIRKEENKRSYAKELSDLIEIQILPFFIGLSINKEFKLLSIYDGNSKNIRMQLTDDEYHHLKLAFL
jgi:hypothetical protein